jgi:hypothetical protein
MYLSEPLQLWKLAAAGAVVAGLFLSMIRSTKPVCPSSAGLDVRDPRLGMKSSN